MQGDRIDKGEEVPSFQGGAEKAQPEAPQVFVVVQPTGKLSLAVLPECEAEYLGPADPALEQQYNPDYVQNFGNDNLRYIFSTITYIQPGFIFQHSRAIIHVLYTYSQKNY